MAVKRCHNCGVELTDNRMYCANCGTANNFEEPEEKVYVIESNKKSKLAGGLLGIFLGGYGIHNFYLGYTNKAMAQLLMSTIGWFTIVAPIAAYIWGFIEGIMIISGSIDKDANGVPLRN